MKLKNPPPRKKPDPKFWHCSFCHKGLTARDLHDITNHKIRCWTCFESSPTPAAAPAPQPAAPTPKAPAPTLWDVFWEKVENQYPFHPTDRFTLTDKGREAICGNHPVLKISVPPKG